MDENLLNSKVSVHLARMPVQNLNKTIAKYMNSCKPLLSMEEYAETLKEAREMLKKTNICSKLQTLLLNRAESHQNWLTDLWIRAAYLEFRASLLLSQSPGITFNHRAHKTDDEYITYATKVVLGTLEFKKLIDSGRIKQEYAGNVPLDMEQYQKIFSVCRLPANSCDSIEFYPDSKYIAIVCNNHFYSIDVFDKDLQPIGLEMLMNQLKFIFENSKEAVPGIGLMTATNRDMWAENYKVLSKFASNQTCIKDIQSSIFLLCLDKPIGEKFQKNFLTASAHQMLHGGGVCFNAGNRWMDKVIQLIVSRDGISGLTFEHSTSEAIPFMAMADYIQDYIDFAKSSVSSTKCEDCTPRLLNFKLDKNILQAIECARLEVFKVHGKPGAQYESASLRKFRHGRTEAIRSCSTESLDFAKSMMNKNVRDKMKISKLKSAISVHKAYVVDAMNGEGVDRHLLGLQMLASDANLDAPAFFKTSGYLKSGSWKIITSQVPSKYKHLVAFGARTMDSYGICYNPRENEIFMSISSYKSSFHTNNAQMSETLTRAFAEIEKCLVNK